MQNWAANLEYAAARVHRPASIEAVQEVVRNGEELKALGTRHSFNTVADTSGDHVSLELLNRVAVLNEQHHSVTVEGGIRYGELGRTLNHSGFALKNLASLPHISVAGACSTATHGSGVHNGNLATEVCGLEIVNAKGDLISVTKKKDGDIFNGAVVALGALGIVVRLTLDIIPSYQISQTVYENLPFGALEKHFNAITESAYSVSLFTFWTSDHINQVWLKSKSPSTVTPDQFGAQIASGPRSPLPNGVVENCTEQMGVHGDWYDRLPHFRMGFTPSSGEELQTEYFVPRESAWQALSAINAMRDQIAPLLHTTEIRCIAADDLWLSPNYHRDSVAIHFTWKKDWERVQHLLPIIESQLAPFEARPHWGKLFTMGPDRLKSLYPRLPEFRDLTQTFDPKGKFRNDFLRNNIL